VTELPSPEPWRQLTSQPGPDYHIFKVRLDTLENPRTGAAMERVVLETPDWVNVIALTPERRALMVRQFRFGAGTITTEIPGGIVDRGEDHGETARRELLEETGYAGERWTYLGRIQPNPAIQDNQHHLWMAEDCVLVQPPRPDDGEDIAVGTLSLDEVRAQILDGTIGHSLVVAAFSRVLDLRRMVV
jgi:ADP-ribose pyrophosphatase